mgnify:FL=1
MKKREDSNGDIQISEKGELLRTMNVKDGFGLKTAIKKGFKVCIISAGTNAGVKSRLEGLGVQAVYLNAQNKIDI